MLTMRSGGWVLSLAAVGIAVILVQAFRPGVETIGDGRNVESYRFDLDSCLVPRDGIVTTGMPRDAVPALTDPEAYELEVLDGLKVRERKRVLVKTDQVIGVVAGGEARAYPLRVVRVHEVVNDTLGGTPIAVTCQPLCDGMAVFDRTVDGEALVFAMSGLVWNSCQLLYDRRAEVGGESLWSPLQARAVAGPAAVAGRTLARLPFHLATFAEWREAHPGTTVLAPDRRHAPLYKRNMYGNYLITKNLRFPVAPYPPPGPPDAWSRVVLIGAWLLPAEDVDSSVLAHALWWAWHAAHPEDEPVTERGPATPSAD
jgi:hypothetical protein